MLQSEHAANGQSTTKQGPSLKSHTVPSSTDENESQNRNQHQQYKRQTERSLQDGCTSVRSLNVYIPVSILDSQYTIMTRLTVGWLVFNGTFNTDRLRCAYKVKIMRNWQIINNQHKYRYTKNTLKQSSFQHSRT